MRVIGITGRAGAGKDTVANMINSKLHMDRYSFALPLKKACCDLFDWDFNTVETDRTFKEAIDPRWGFSPRMAMQLMGTEYGRNMLREDIWLIKASIELSKAKNGFIIPDVRFENEADWVREKGGILIHVIRDTKDAPKVRSHASEDGVESHPNDVIIWNNGSFDQLLVQVQTIISNMDNT